jgi:hypothetical protein
VVESLVQLVDEICGGVEPERDGGSEDAVGSLELVDQPGPSDAGWCRLVWTTRNRMHGELSWRVT